MEILCNIQGTMIMPHCSTSQLSSSMLVITGFLSHIVVPGYIHQFLVGGLEHQFYFPINIGLHSYPLIDELIFFSGVAKNHQPDFRLGFSMEKKIQRPWDTFIYDCVYKVVPPFISWFINHSKYRYNSHKPKL